MSTSTEERLRGGITNHQVEYQMRFRELISRASDRSEADFDGLSCGPFLTISRESGSRGAEVAQRVGERLDWPVLDKELVEQLAGDLELEPRVLALLDERRSNWFSETLLNLFNTRLVAQQGYVELLGKVVALAAAADPVIIVGRGAHLILPPDSGFRIRVIAPREFRAHQISRAEGLNLRAAEKRIDDVDDDRRGFVMRNLHEDVTDPSLYDLVLNSASLGVHGCVEVITRALEVRAPQGPGVASPAN